MSSPNPGRFINTLLLPFSFFSSPLFLLQKPRLKNRGFCIPAGRWGRFVFGAHEAFPRSPGSVSPLRRSIEDYIPAVPAIIKQKKRSCNIQLRFFCSPDSTAVTVRQIGIGQLICTLVKTPIRIRMTPAIRVQKIVVLLVSK